MTINNKYKYLGICLLIFTVSCKDNNDREIVPVLDFEIVQGFYIESINESLVYIDSLATYPSESSKAKDLFKSLRIAFKRAEPYASYLNPEVGQSVNGPALPSFTDDTERVLAAVGLQKIEETIYEGGVSKEVYQEEIKLTKGLLHVLKKNVEQREMNTQRFFISIHQQLLRIISLGVSGFDTPVSHLGINETIISLESLQFVYENSIQKIIILQDEKLNEQFLNNISKAILFIKNNKEFETLDRYRFIRDYMNVITKNWVEIRKTSDLWEPIDTTPFNFDAATFFEDDSFNTDYFTPPADRKPSDKQIALGKKLFFDKKLSANNSVSCASCHNPEKGYADGLKTSIDNAGNKSLRNAPTLLNTVFQKSFFLDGRAQTLTDQISLVFKNKQEFNTEIHQFSDRILSDTTYTKMLIDVFGHVPTKNTEVITAISSYISTLKGFNSKFDKNIRGEENNLTISEINGVNLFMGKALCATCHFMPLTNGTVPPFYTESEREVIGVPKTNKNKELDSDLGYYWRYNEAMHLGMFKTPTLRNIALTAPYMHNGVYNTLEEVMDFYNKGGGAGLGFDLPHQTLPFDKLELSKGEIRDLIAFMKTLTDSN